MLSFSQQLNFKTLCQLASFTQKKFNERHTRCVFFDAFPRFFTVKTQYIYIRTVGLLNFGTFNSFLAGLIWEKNRVQGAFYLSPTTLVQTSSAKQKNRHYLSAYCPNTYCEFRRTRNVSGQSLLKHCDRRKWVTHPSHIDNFQYLNFRLGIKKNVQRPTIK